MEKKGYLQENFRLFHIRDKVNKTFSYHYHDFNKIIIFLSGKVTYLVEGKTYELKPWDILLVNHHAIHKPVIDPGVYYERIVIYVDDEYLNSRGGQLSSCFRKADERSFNLIRMGSDAIEEIKRIVSSLEMVHKEKDSQFGHELLKESLFMELMVSINRIFLNKDYDLTPSALKYDKRMEEILKYIHTNLSEDLSVETLSEHFFLSRYYLMHRFKEETGYTLHNYILQKRLYKAALLRADGVSATEAALMCGFKDYSTYYRALRRESNMRTRNSSGDTDDIS